MHSRYRMEHQSTTAIAIFWSMVFSTSTKVLNLKYTEYRREKTKEGVYEGSWQDHERTTTSTTDTTATDTVPFAKIYRLGSDLYDSQKPHHVNRVRALHKSELIAREEFPSSQALRRRSRDAANHDDDVWLRQSVFPLITTADEELHVLPEDLLARLNKILHRIDEADARTTRLVHGEKENKNDNDEI